MPCSGVTSPSSTGPPWAPGGSEQRGPGLKHRGTPSLLEVRLQGAGLLLAVLSSQGHCFVAPQFPPFLLRLETYPLPPRALTKAPLTLSPSDFPSRGFEELGFAGGGRNGTH